MSTIGDVIRVYWAPSSTPLSTSPTWTEITDKVRRVTITAGRSAAFDQYAPTAATVVVDNRVGTINPTAWYRWRQVKIEATTGGGIYVLFRGFIQETRHDQGRAPYDAVAEIRAEDVLSILARKEIAYGVPYGDSVVPKESTDDRVDRILTAAGIPAAFIDTTQASSVIMSQPSALVDSTDEAGVLVGNALELLQACVECEMGALYTDGGLLRFENRYALVDRTRSPSLYPTFSNTATGSEVPFLRDDLVLVPSGTDYRNSVSFTPTSGNTKTATNIPSGFPSDSLSYTVPLASDNQATGNAQGLLEVYRQQETWPERITCHVYPDRASILSAIAPLEVRDYAIVEFTPVGKTQQTYKVFVSGYTHDIEPGSWRTSVQFESADRWYDAWGATNFVVLNSASSGQLNEEALAY